jgi:NAD(P)H-flavin reductase
LNDLVDRDVVLVTGGLGLAPVRPLIYWIAKRRERFGKVWLIHGSRSPDSLLYEREYDAWRSNRIDVQTTVDRGSGDWKGDVGPVTTTLDRLPLANPSSTVLVTCGPEPMMKYVALGAERLGIENDRLWISLERNMQCAVGMCGHCLFGPAFVCKDGPVFRYDRIRPYLQVEGL